MKQYILMLALLIMGVAELSAQSGTYYTIRDFETWSSATLAFKANKKVKFGIGQNLRLNDNSSVVDKYFTEGFLNIKLSKPITLGAELRHIRFNDNEGKIQGYENHLRHALNLRYKHEISRFNFNYRIQYQSRNEVGASTTLSNDPTKKLRFRIGSEYNIKKWKLDPQVSAEIFRTIGTDGGFSKFRATIGTSYDLKKAGSIDLFYRAEKELNENYPLLAHIVGVNYKYTIKRKKK